MKQFIVILYFFLSLSFVLKGVELKEIRVIGNEEDDYTFFRIGGAVLSKNSDIYVVDIKGAFIARYDWSGKFIKRIGREGAGPGELKHPNYLNLHQDKLYTLDRSNFRIAETDLELNSIKYHKIYDGTMFSNNFFVLDDQTFIGPSLNVKAGSEGNKIRVLNVKKNQNTSFFNHDPVKLSMEEKASKYYNISKFFYFDACSALDSTSKQMLISFFFPDNPVMFYLYSIDGKYLDSFSHKIEDKYRFSLDRFKNPYNPPKTSFVPIVYNMFIHKDMYIVFLLKVEYRKRLPVDKEIDCLIFDRKSKALKHRFQVAKDLKCFFISDEGYILGSKLDEEIQKLYVYKLEI